MTVENELKALIAQIAYHDHEHDTNIAEELTDVIVTVKTLDLTHEEAVELLEDRLEMMKLNSILEKDEDIRLVQTIIRQLPGLLFG